MRFFDFEYDCIIKRKINDEIDVVGYNSPYKKKNNQPIDDIRYAICEQKVVNIQNLPIDRQIHLKIKCRNIIDGNTIVEQIFYKPEIINA